MGEFVVWSEFIKKTQPFFCGVGVFKKDATVCAEKPNDLDLGRYNRVGKWLDYLPFHESEEVQYCKVYVDIYQQSNGLCLDTPEEAQTSLHAVIEGMGTPITMESVETAARQIPTYAQIYAMIARQQPGVSSDQFRRMQPYLVQKAKRIHEGLVELDRLRKEPDVDPAAIEQRQVDLLQEIRQTCIENNPDSLRQLQQECKEVIDNYDTVKARQKWIVGVGTAAAAAIAAFVRSGRAAKSIEAARAEWREAGRVRPPQYQPICRLPRREQPPQQGPHPTHRSRTRR